MELCECTASIFVRFVQKKNNYFPKGVFKGVLTTV